MSNGHWAGSIDFGASAGPGWEIAGAGKFFGSNAPSDVLWFNSNTGAVNIWEMSNGNWAGTEQIGSFGPGWQVAAIGDFTGNGTDDIMFYNAASGDVSEWIMANGHWAGSVDLGNHPGMQISAVGDFTHNGTTDVLWTQLALK